MRSSNKKFYSLAFQLVKKVIGTTIKSAKSSENMCVSSTLFSPPLDNSLYIDIARPFRPLFMEINVITIRRRYGFVKT